MTSCDNQSIRLKTGKGKKNIFKFKIFFFFPIKDKKKFLENISIYYLKIHHILIPSS